MEKKTTVLYQLIFFEYYCGMMNKMAVDLVLIKKEQMVFTNQMIKKKEIGKKVCGVTMGAT